MPNEKMCFAAMVDMLLVKKGGRALTEEKKLGVR